MKMSLRKITEINRTIPAFLKDFPKTLTKSWPIWEGLSPESKDTITNYTSNLDVVEKDGAYLVEIQLPGLKAGDIDLNLQGNCLKITNSSSLLAETNGEKSTTPENLERRVNFPQKINPDKVFANFENEVLKITAHKIKEKPRLNKKILINNQ